MPIYTTYLGNKPKAQAQKLGSCFVYFIMRAGGNNEVAPSKKLLQDAKAGKINWDVYSLCYLTEINNFTSRQWMEKRAEEARVGNVLLVCYEKDATHCHRRLLAEEIAKRFGVEYKGELP